MKREKFSRHQPHESGAGMVGRGYEALLCWRAMAASWGTGYAAAVDF